MFELFQAKKVKKDAVEDTQFFVHTCIKCENLHGCKEYHEIKCYGGINFNLFELPPVPEAT